MAIVKISLPIDSHLPRIVSCFAQSSSVIIVASPGSGKTTRVPPALLAASLISPDKEIWVLVPRRLAAKAAAERVCAESGTVIGDTIGYQFRFEKKGGAKTRLWFMTEGILMRRFLDDPALSRAGCVILDEFHERHLHTDVALSLVRELQNTSRPDLKIGIMSATLDPRPVSLFLGDGPILTIDAPVYPLEVRYFTPKEKYLEHQVARALETHLGENKYTGDILVFLPGMREIRRCEEKLGALASAHHLALLPLHGDLSRAAQDAVFNRGNKRRVILSTNIAESSLTIDGVDTVIDTGLCRRASYSWWSGIPSLHTRPISQASARQRSGRAGRTGPGLALRLYSEMDYKSRPAEDTPEIGRADLTQTFLELKKAGLNPVNLNWYEPPPQAATDSAVNLLFNLGALLAPQPSAELTDYGRQMAALPAHPRFSRLLLEGARLGVADEVATITAHLSEGSSDNLDVLSLLSKPLSDLQKKARSLYSGSFPAAGSPRPGREAIHSLVAQSLLAGFADRVAQKRKESQRQAQSDLVFCFGGSGVVSSEELGLADHFIILDVQERKPTGAVRSKLHVSCLCPIETEWLLDLPPLGQESGLIWDAQRKRVMERHRMTYDKLVLEESSQKATFSEKVSRLLFKEGLGIDLDNAEHRQLHHILKALAPFGNAEALESTLARLELMSRYAPEAGFPALHEDDGWQELIKMFESCVSLSEFEGLDWEKTPLRILSPEQQAKLARELPLQVTLKRGRPTRIQYRLGQTPWIESFLQDFIGMTQGPLLMGGKLALNLHLLAPNRRPVQITTDLNSFWKNIYPEIRNQLARKYPRREWP